MKTTLIHATALGTLLLFGQAPLQANTGNQTAEEQTRLKYETGGALSGVALGALAGGPVGAVVSAVAGTWFGNVLHQARSSKELRTSLREQEELFQELQLANSRLQEQNLTLAGKLDQANLQASNNPLPAQTSACCTNGELILHFRTNSSTLEPHYLPLLEEFVAQARTQPGSVVEVSGYADRRGEPDNNLALSQRRVQEVERTLRELGLRDLRIETSARGEGQPLAPDDTLESHFFNRRVQLRLRSTAAFIGQHQP